MVSQFASSKVLLLSMDYCSDSQEVSYLFLVDGVGQRFKGRMHDCEIRGVEYSAELDAFIMSLMPMNEKISKIIFSISWGVVDGEEIGFPIVLA